jgi:hypothetical protein
MKWLSTIILVIVMASAAPAGLRTAQAASLNGSYSCTGTNPNGSTYNGTVVISRVEGIRYRFDWSISGQHFSGTGVLDGDTISVDWGQASPVIYRVGNNGVLHGTWANGRGTEILRP